VLEASVPNDRDRRTRQPGIRQLMREVRVELSVCRGMGLSACCKSAEELKCRDGREDPITRYFRGTRRRRWAPAMA
jgi:hypothetical protein